MKIILFIILFCTAAFSQNIILPGSITNQGYGIHIPNNSGGSLNDSPQTYGVVPVNNTTPGYDPDAVAFFNRTDGTLPDSIKGFINTWIVGLKSDTIFNKADCRYLMCLNDTANSHLNVMSSSYTLVSIASHIPTFTQYKGFTGNGSSQYLFTNYIPSTNGIAWSQNSCSMGFYSPTALFETAKIICGSLNSGTLETSIWNYSAIIKYFALNGNETNLANIDDTHAFFFITRNNTAVTYYRNISNLISYVEASTGNMSKQIYFLCLNNNGAAAFFSAKLISYGIIGGGYTANQETMEYNRLLTLLTSIGAN